MVIFNSLNEYIYIYMRQQNPEKEHGRGEERFVVLKCHVPRKLHTRYTPEQKKRKRHEE